LINAGDTAFVLVSAALVSLMTPGLAFFYGGLVGRRNVITIMIQVFVSMGIVTAIWVLGGFSLAFGHDWHGIIGNLQYFGLRGVGMMPNPAHGPHIPFLAFFSFQEMFAIITPALITGAFADRVKFTSYLKFLVLWSILVYIPIAHWLWGGGFLAQLGAVDFAGGMVVHASAGLAALASVFVIGKRVGPETDRAPHNLAFVALGTGLLWFGWFGFNAGSALAANGVAAAAFVNTDIAASIAMLAWLAASWLHDRRPTILGVLTGAVAGLATITPAAGYVQPWGAVIIGVLAGLICYMAIRLRVRLDWDDALDVWGVHGVGGALGSVLVGVLAISVVNGTRGLVQGDVRQFLVQLLAVGVTSAYAFGMTYLILKVLNVFEPLRVPQDVERSGLDAALHGETAYL
jgi:ammonium transporter, Amt family